MTRKLTHWIKIKLKISDNCLAEITNQLFDRVKKMANRGNFNCGKCQCTIFIHEFRSIRSKTND